MLFRITGTNELLRCNATLAILKHSVSYIYKKGWILLCGWLITGRTTKSLIPLTERNLSAGKLSSGTSGPSGCMEHTSHQSGLEEKNGHYHRSSKGGGEWEFFSLPQQWSIHYGKLTFQLKPFSFKHTGLFLSRLQTGIGFLT